MWRSWTITEQEAMGIKRDESDAGPGWLFRVATGKRFSLVHPGEILCDDFLQPMKISVYAPPDLTPSARIRQATANNAVLAALDLDALC
jgi:hypothetical protein